MNIRVLGFGIFLTIVIISCRTSEKNTMLVINASENYLKHNFITFLYLPTQNVFSDWRRMCHGSKLTNSLRQTKLTNSVGNSNMNISLTRMQAVHFETTANLCFQLASSEYFLCSFFFQFLSWEV